MAWQCSVLVLIVSVAFAAAVSPTRHIRSLVSKRDPCGVMSCVAPLMKYENPTTGFKLAALDDKAVLDQLCSDLNTATECISSKATSCPHFDSETQLVVDTLEGVVTYMCSAQGKDALLSETDCWDNPGLERAIEACGDIESQAHNFDFNDPCSILHYFRTCVTDEVAGTCSDKAVQFADGLVYHAMKPAADYYFGGCSFEPPTQTQMVDILKRAVDNAVDAFRNRK